MSITPGQCRAARALLNWPQSELVSRSGVSQAAIANFERGASTPYPRTLKDIRETFEMAGLVFLDDGPAGGTGVRFKAGVSEPRLIGTGSHAGSSPSGDGLGAQAWDEVVDATATAPADPAFPPLPITNEMREEVREMLKTVDISPLGRAILTRDFRL